MENYPRFAQLVLIRISKGLRALLDRLARLVYASAHQRIACAIIDWSTLNGRLAEAELPTQDQWASMIDVSRETLARYLTDLQNQRIITKERRKIIVHDVERLRKLMSSSEYDPKC